ncbi:MAG: hypothetical protein DME32_02370 [Verrucomicrobia bacterium]|nr:MAG: hypothetical protein DME32_02370 [Verrucomicrobiota bacterium]
MKSRIIKNAVSLEMRLTTGLDSRKNRGLPRMAKPQPKGFLSEDYLRFFWKRGRAKPTEI